MNHCVPDWSIENDYGPFHAAFPAANQLKSVRPEPLDPELIELLWQNGHIVMNSQTHRKMTSLNEKQHQRHEVMLKDVEALENSIKVVDAEQTTTWLHYPLDESLDKEFSSDFYGLPTESPSAQKINDVTEEGERFGKYEATEDDSMENTFNQPNDPSFDENMIPSKPHVIPSFTQSRDNSDAVSFSHFTRPPRTDLRTGEKSLGNKNQGEAGEEPSLVMKETSICGSNQVQGQFNMKRCNALRVTSEKGGHGYSFGRTGQKSAETKSHKRKARDADESELQSEEAEYESMEGDRPVQRSASTRRSRAAEVHNLAERRRRDKINEKMRALQELIPHCNKSDKASMLDEAIEYLKSLQLQVQMMWMGSSMAAMMFPGIQHYMPHMGMGMGHGSMPPVPGPVHLPRFPVISQSMPSNPAINQGYQAPLFPSSFVSPVNFQKHIQSCPMPEPCGQYLGLHRGQPSPQVMNFHGSLLMQQNPTALAPSSSAPRSVAVPSEHTQNVKAG